MKAPPTVRPAGGEVGENNEEAKPFYSNGAPTATPTPLSDDGLFNYGRIISGANSYCFECLAPDLERTFIDLIRKMTHRLNYLAGKPAYAQEAAEAYQQERGKVVPLRTTANVRRKEAPAVVLDAVIYSCRERGVSAALEYRDNVSRISSMSKEQRAELNSRIQKLVDAGEIRP